MMRKPRSGHDFGTGQKQRLKQPPTFSEIKDLEDLVHTKDDLVTMIDDSEENIEQLLDTLASKKKEIRDEQNKLLKELEDLGLKLKDFDKPVGVNLRHCTVVSPYLTRCSQQVINKLQGVSENLSNKETKNEIKRAVESIAKEREERETLVISLLSLDIVPLHEKLSLLSEELTSKNSEKIDAVQSIELLSTEILELEESIRKETEYQEELDHLRSMKATATSKATSAADVLNEIAHRKVQIEKEIKETHYTIREGVKSKNAITRELNDTIEAASYQPMTDLIKKTKVYMTDEEESYEILSDFMDTLKQLEVSRQMDYDISAQETLSSTRDLYLDLLNLAGRVLSMLGKTNAETALLSFRTERLTEGAVRSVPMAIVKRVVGVVDSLTDVVKIKFSEDSKPVFIDGWNEDVKAYLTQTCKISENLYELMARRCEMVSRVEVLMREAQAKEQECSELNRQRSEIVNRIPELKQETRAYNYQLAVLQSQVRGGVVQGDETPRETVDEIDKEFLEHWPRKTSNPERFCTQEEIKAARVAECEELQARLRVLSESIGEIEENIRQVELEQEYIQEKVKTYRRGIIEGYQNELKEFQCIASLFDYMSKPILSREIGVSVVDNLLHDLSSIVSQTSIEIGRQKRIIKLVNKGEDYSHEGMID